MLGLFTNSKSNVSHKQLRKVVLLKTKQNKKLFAGIRNPEWLSAYEKNSRFTQDRAEIRPGERRDGSMFLLKSAGHTPKKR